MGEGKASPADSLPSLTLSSRYHQHPTRAAPTDEVRVLSDGSRVGMTPQPSQLSASAATEAPRLQVPSLKNVERRERIWWTMSTRPKQASVTRRSLLTSGIGPCDSDVHRGALLCCVRSP